MFHFNKSITFILIVFLGVIVSGCQVPGCTDPLSCNFNPNATLNDGSCDYSCFGNSCSNGYITKSGSITADETWTANCTYRLVGKVVVDSGVVLTIDPGALIKSETTSGVQTELSMLIVSRGAKIIANGTQSEPIIFTSMLDNIQLGQLSGTNLDQYQNALWGGVVILGDAPISAANGDTESQIEGIPMSVAFGGYGGHDVQDNSGSLNYISIRHAGEYLGAGNHLNGLTLAGVGGATQISNIEIVGAEDDGVELFGGNVNLTNVIVGYFGDDGIDIDQNYDGMIDNFICLADTVSDEGIELDGPEGITYTNGTFTLQNGTVRSVLGAGGMTHSLFRNVKGTVINVDFGEEIVIQASYTANCSASMPDAFTNLTSNPTTLNFLNCARNVVTVFSPFCSVSAADQMQAEIEIPSVLTMGADVIPFTGWTWFSIHGHI
ncbi:MAG: hypothetical protein MK066_08405 [Crocinitomicaceae bacterium]|nr:hypothetical protein [Crocinitomicaceae bacterium]